MGPFSWLKFDEVASFCDKLNDCKGIVHFVSLGNSSYTAKKICQTLISTGTPANWLSPVDALHGDIGAITASDVVVVLSKSGSSPELLTFLPYARAKDAFIVALTGDSKSRVAVLSDMHVLIPGAEGTTHPEDSQRRDHCQVARLTYAASQLLFGDTCAVHLMNLKGFCMGQYACNHPAGRIGKRMILKVKDIAIPKEVLATVKPEDPAFEALVRLAGKSKGCCCLLVVDGEFRLLGTLSDADLRRALTKVGEKALELPVRDVMNYKKSFPRTTTMSTMAFEAQMKMGESPSVDYMPVLSDDGENILLGLLTSHHLAEAGL